MATKRRENPFAISPLSPGTRLPSTGRAMVPHTQPRPLTRRERKTIAEGAYQGLVIHITEEKTRIGQRAMAELTHSAAQIFVETAQEIWDVKNSVTDAELRLLTDTFCVQQAKLCGVYEEEATAAGNNQILGEIERGVHHDPIPPSFLDRLRGRDEE